MTMLTLRRLTDKTLAKYEALEKEGKLTTRQRNALVGHRLLPSAVRAMRENSLEDNPPQE